MSCTDQLLEDAIDRARESFAQSQSREQMHERWLALAALIDRRSPQQVRRMEEERGLR